MIEVEIEARCGQGVEGLRIFCGCNLIVGSFRSRKLIQDESGGRQGADSQKIST
jgi:hypothetical protein